MRRLLRSISDFHKMFKPKERSSYDMYAVITWKRFWPHLELCATRGKLSFASS